MNKNEFFANARTDLTGPLAGLRVLEATTSWAGPMVGCLLADYGAEVIKVEHPDGEILRHLPPHVPGSDQMPIMYEIVNRNKKSLSLDIHSEEGRDIFLKLVESCDIFVENFKPGTLASWQLGYEHLKSVRQDIIYVSVSGFGQFGPLHDRVAYDPLAQAFAGWMSLNGEVDGQPVKAPTFLADDLAGIHATVATLAALNHRRETGEGQHVDVCLVDSVLAISNAHPSNALMGNPVEKYANEFPSVAPFNTYQCKDGWIYAGAVLDAQWAKLCDVMGCAQFAVDDRYARVADRVANRGDVNHIVARWCAVRTTNETILAMGKAGIPVAEVNDFATAARSEHVIARDMMPEIELSDGSRAPVTGPVAKFSRTPVAIRFPSQPLGAQNAELLAEVGIDEGALAKLSEKGIV